MREVLLSPPVAMGFFMAFACGLYWLGRITAASGRDHPDRRLPYACGEDLAPVRTSYQAFFKLVLQFGILHLAALVISTLPANAIPHHLATFYLIGVGISVIVLTGRVN